MNCKMTLSSFWNYQQQQRKNHTNMGHNVKCQMSNCNIKMKRPNPRKKRYLWEFTQQNIYPHQQNVSVIKSCRHLNEVKNRYKEHEN